MEKKLTPHQLLANLDKGIEAYHDDVQAMTDRELWEHCFADGDVREDDFCVQELKFRFLYKSCMTDEGARQFLIDNGQDLKEIEEIAERIKLKVLEKIKELSELPAPPPA